MYDKFGNEIRRINNDELDECYGGLKHQCIGGMICSAVAAIIIGIMLYYLTTNNEIPRPVVIIVAAAFGITCIWAVISSLISLIHFLAGNIGVIHVCCDDIGFSGSSSSKRPSRYVKAYDINGKQICYSITAAEWESIRTTSGHIKEVDFAVINPDKIKYKNYSSFFTLKNICAPILSSAVYDDADKAVDNLSNMGGIIRVKRKSDK